MQHEADDDVDGLIDEWFMRLRKSLGKEDGRDVGEDG
jgi:hypothetical protein